MARVDTKKFLFVGIRDEKDAFFEKAQDLGIIHFNDMHGKTPKTAMKELDVIIHAIKIIRTLTPVEQEETEEFALADGLAFKVIQLNEQLEKLNEELRILKLEKARVHVFGNFSLEEIKRIEDESNRKIQFFAAKPTMAEEGKIPAEAIYIDTDSGLDYYVTISETPIFSNDMIEMIIDHPIGILHDREMVVNREIQLIEERIKAYAKYNEFLHKALVYKMDTFNLKQNKKFAAQEMNEELFVVTGWVPVTKLDAMRQLVEELHVYAEEVAAEPDEVAPTSLENTGIHRIGEDIINIYDTPSNTDKDPSLWVLAWFALFFAMIIGDVIYGFVFLAIALYVHYRVKPVKAGAKRLVKLIAILGATVVVWGVLTNAYFGIPLSPNHPLREYSMLTWLNSKKIAFYQQYQTKQWHEIVEEYPNVAQMHDPYEILTHAVVEKNGQPVYELAESTATGTMMELALLIGVIHICLGFARYARRNISGIGWIIAIIGGFLYLPTQIEAPTVANYVFGLSYEEAALNGKYMLIAGFTMACLGAIYQHKWLGLIEPMHIVQIFADIMSYLRLFALGLAGAIVSSIIFEFASAMPYVLAIGLILIGHTVNFTLAIMGGVIHGLRLNFLEWYHYSFEGGGRRYNPLRKMAKQL